MKQNKITIDRNSVKELNRTQLENVLFAVYNDNIALKKKIDEMDAIIAELKEFRNLANAEKYTPSSEALQGLFPELEVMIQYSYPVEEENPADGGDAKVEKKPRKPKKPNLVLPADAEVSIVDKTIGIPDTKTMDGVEYKRGKDEVTLKLGYTPAKRKVTPHVYRHTFCTNMVNLGMDAKVLQYIMGHSEIDVTMNIYTHMGFEHASSQMLRLVDGTGESKKTRYEVV